MSVMILMSLLVVIPRSVTDLTSSTKHRGVSIALFLFGVLMPKGERAIS